MTVKELEEALGMSRANIRYYEKEGLLAPVRLENGYRNYTAMDRADLEKIKLLRRLGLPVEEIRALQRGERDLAAALGEREDLLGREVADREAARSLCRQMEAEGARYDAMDAGRYLARMEELTQAGTRFPDLVQDALPTVSRPWVRFFARSLDMALCALLLSALLLGVLRLDLPTGLLMTLATNYLSWGILFFLEPLLLSTWGYTPGKWAFGLKVRDGSGRRLTFQEAFRRLAGVFVRGEGYGIPFYDLFRNWRSYQLCAGGQALPWEEGLAYTGGECSARGGVSYVAVQAGSLALTFLLAVYTLMPSAKGPLTVAEFARSYNDVAQRYDLGGDRVLDETGRWTQRQTGGTTIYLGAPPPDLTFTLEGDRVRQVRLEAREPDFFAAPGEMDGWSLAALLTLLGAQREVGLLQWTGAVEGISEALGPPLESWTVTYRGLTLTQTVTYSGYEALGPDYLIPVEGVPQVFCRVITMEAAGDL